jgi:serine/threonine protein kinase
VADEMRGRRARCKKCGTQFVLELAEEAEASVMPAPVVPAAAAAVPDRPAELELAPLPANYVAPFSTLTAAAITTAQAGEEEQMVAGRYRLGRVLGKGNFGLVYHAFDIQLEREVAVKLLHADTAASPEAVSRFQREAKAAARLHHPHIVPVFDAGRHGDNYFLVAAYVEGQTLDKLLPETGVEPRRAVTWVLQLLDALQAAHQQGVLHRDVKSGNLIIDATDRLHLMDFGLAGWTQDQDHARLTQAGAFMGTPAFTAPEQARGEHTAVGPWSDVYSVGVVLYQLLTGHVPFEGPLARVIYQVLEEPAPSPLVHKPELDRELERICMRALLKDTRRRYRSCEEMATPLRTWLANQPTGPVPLTAARHTSLPPAPQASITTPRDPTSRTYRDVRGDKPTRRPEPQDFSKPVPASGQWREAEKSQPPPDQTSLHWVLIFFGLVTLSLIGLMILLAIMLINRWR